MPTFKQYNGQRKVCVPTSLHSRTVSWYHMMLCHPGENCTEATIRHHFYLPYLQNTVEECVRPCRTCQVSKKGQKIKVK